uniref:cilia- and flagella-associated protein 47-like n=1 Tax=Myxine glutinosa TaxID=7769 RepID=UPI00358EC886
MKKDGAAPTADLVLTTALRRAEFGIVSRKAWTDVLLQVYKVFVLARVTPESLSRPLAKIYLAGGVVQQFALHLSTEPLDSNVYSSAESTLLCWLNQHYSMQRARIWPDKGKTCFQHLLCATAQHCALVIQVYLLVACEQNGSKPVRGE